MFATERQQAIVDQAHAMGRVDVLTLAHELQVTPETIRRDLRSPERRRLVRRTYGGAVPVEWPGSERPGSERPDRELDRIARAAVAELPQEGAVLLDSGPASAALARLLPGGRELTVVTNGLPVAVLLAERAGITLHVLGGRTQARSLATVARWTQQALTDIFVDVAFLDAGGVSVERGLTTPDRAEAAVKRAMMASARRTVVLADHTTFATDTVARFGDLADVDVLISGTALDPGLAAEIGRAGPRVVRA